MAVRSKFTVQKITQVSWSKDARIIEFGAVTADGVPENERYHKYTPSGTVNITVDNPPAAAQFELGKTFYVDFTPAE